MHLQRFIALALSFLLGACASNLKVTYNSDPPGASLYQGSQLMGYTPMTLQYQVSDADRRSGIKVLQGTSVKWASGAEANVTSLNANLNQFGLNQQFTFQRPNIPGREIDVQVSLKLQELAIQRQMAQTQRDQAFNQYLQSLRPPPRRQTNCTSTLIGNTVQTNCY